MFSWPIIAEFNLLVKAVANTAEGTVLAIGGNAEEASAAFKRIADAAVQYSEENIIAGPINGAIRRGNGEIKEADLIGNKVANGVSKSMDLFQPIPVLGVVATSISSLAHALDGNEQQARAEWTKYTERSLIAGSVNSAIKAIEGDEKEAQRIASRMGTAVLGSTQIILGEAARMATGGFNNPVSGACRKMGGIFVEESNKETPDLEKAGKEALLKGANGFISGAYIPDLGQIVEDAMREDIFKEKISEEEKHQRLVESRREILENVVSGGICLGVHKSIEASKGNMVLEKHISKQIIVPDSGPLPPRPLPLPIPIEPRVEVTIPLSVNRARFDYGSKSLEIPTPIIINKENSKAENSLVLSHS